ncbi:MAG: hypothetical protein RIC85_06200 [Gammaproteobacteria bacterium]
MPKRSNLVIAGELTLVGLADAFLYLNNLRWAENVTPIRVRGGEPQKKFAGGVLAFVGQAAHCINALIE